MWRRVARRLAEVEGLLDGWGCAALGAVQAALDITATEADTALGHLVRRGAVKYITVGRGVGLYCRAGVEPPPPGAAVEACGKIVYITAVRVREAVCRAASAACGSVFSVSPAALAAEHAPNCESPRIRQIVAYYIEALFGKELLGTRKRGNRTYYRLPASLDGACSEV
jgi:hypothetical protein